MLANQIVAPAGGALCTGTNLGRNGTGNIQTTTVSYLRKTTVRTVVLTRFKNPKQKNTAAYHTGEVARTLCYHSYLERLRQGEGLFGRVVHLLTHPAGLGEEHGRVEHVAAVHAGGAAGGLVRVKREKPSFGVYSSPRALQPALHITHIHQVCFLQVRRRTRLGFFNTLSKVDQDPVRCIEQPAERQEPLHCS